MFLAQTVQATLISPYYRYLLPQNNHNDPVRILDTITYQNDRVTFFVKDRSHQFGVRRDTTITGSPQTTSVIVQMIERRPFTARRSVFDDGLIFQYWKTPFTAKTGTILFGYTTDRNVHYVRLKLDQDVKKLDLYDGRYFLCVLNSVRDKPVEAQGIGANGEVLRTWNGYFNYPARRTWLSVFVQSYPYVVTNT